MSLLLVSTAAPLAALACWCRLVAKLTGSKKGRQYDVTGGAGNEAYARIVQRLRTEAAVHAALESMEDQEDDAELEVDLHRGHADGE